MEHDTGRPGAWEWLSRHANIIQIVSGIGAVVPTAITIIGSLPALLGFALAGMFAGAFILVLIAKAVTANSEPAVFLNLRDDPKSRPDRAHPPPAHRPPPPDGERPARVESRTNIVCFKPKLARLVQQDWVFRQAYDVPQLEDYGFGAYLIELENEPIKGRRLDAVTDVQAQLLFYTSANTELGRIEQGAWLGRRGGLMNLEVGTRSALVLAVWWERDGGVKVMGVGSNKDQGVVLKHDWVRVHLRLLSHGEILMNRDYKLIIKSGVARPLIEMLADDQVGLNKNYDIHLSMKATLKSGDEVIFEGLEVSIQERTDPRSGLKSWNGYFRIPRGKHVEPDAYSLELADGRRGEIIVNLVQNFYDAYFVGNGELIVPEK